MQPNVAFRARRENGIWAGILTSSTIIARFLFNNTAMVYAMEDLFDF